MCEETIFLSFFLVSVAWGNGLTWGGGGGEREGEKESEEKERKSVACSEWVGYGGRRHRGGGSSLVLFYILLHPHTRSKAIFLLPQCLKGKLHTRWAKIGSNFYHTNIDSKFIKWMPYYYWYWTLSPAHKFEWMAKKWSSFILYPGECWMKAAGLVCECVPKGAASCMQGTRVEPAHEARRKPEKSRDGKFFFLSSISNSFFALTRLLAVLHGK